MRTRSVETPSGTSRVWEQGDGPVLGYLAGPLGLPTWTPFLDALSEQHRVVVPSVPGYPGGGTAEHLDDMLDWVTAVLDLLDAAGLAGHDLIGASVGGTLAAELAALSSVVPRLVLLSPLGVNHAADPVRNQLASLQRRPELLCCDSAAYATFLERPPDADELEWRIEGERALATNARLLWPLLDTGLAKRLHRITVPTLVLWGEHDRIIPATYADHVAGRISGPTRVEIVPGAGHLVDIDAPADVAKRIISFLGSSAGDG